MRSSPFCPAEMESIPSPFAVCETFARDSVGQKIATSVIVIVIVAIIQAGVLNAAPNWPSNFDYQRYWRVLQAVTSQRWPIAVVRVPEPPGPGRR